jgi:ribosomal protein S12 methylthiotransferase
MVKRASPTSVIDPTDNRGIRVHMISLGCPKNLVDSEMILGNAGATGAAIALDADEADVIVVNTCGFIEAAKEESIQTILEACELKRASPTPKKVVVTGCLAQRYGEELRKEIPEVDAILGLGEYDDIGSVFRSLSAADRSELVYRISEPDKACNAEVGRVRLTPAHYGYIKISEGCDNPCTFCAIPHMRGRFRSKPIELIEQEARELVASGAKELILISQDTTSYGFDISGEFTLPQLLERVSAVDGVEWIRILYAYPAFLTDAMLESVAAIDNVVNYIDLPLQHIADKTLRRMGRRMDERKTRDLLERARRIVPGLYLRTTFIVGFPGETDEEFATLRDFVREFEFERLGVFAYSEEEGTPSATFADQVPPEVRGERLKELMLAQQEIAFRQNHSRRGERTKVLVDRIETLDDGRRRLHGRTFGEAPEIDQSVLVNLQSAATPDIATPESLGPGIRGVPMLGGTGRTNSFGAGTLAGDLLDVTITGSQDYDLIGKLSPPSAPLQAFRARRTSGEPGVGSVESNS